MAEQNKDYKLGQTLGRIAKEQGRRQSAQLKAVISDLIGDDLTLRAPLRELVELPTFLDGEPLDASAQATALVSFLLDELRPVFRDDTLERIQVVLYGYFSLNTVSETFISENRSQAQSKKKHKKAINEQINNRDQKKISIPKNNKPDNQPLSLDTLKHLLVSQNWEEADQVTWKLLVSASGCDCRDSIELIINKIPCSFLVDINSLWCEFSDYYFGFSAQRAIMAELIKLTSSVYPSSTFGFQMQAEEMFREFLQAPNPNPPPGFYPRGGYRYVLERFRNSQLVWDRSYLISNFVIVYSRLVFCDLISVKLNEGINEDLHAIFHKVAISTVVQKTENARTIIHHDDKVNLYKKFLSKPNNYSKSKIIFNVADVLVWILFSSVLLIASLALFAEVYFKGKCDTGLFKISCYIYSMPWKKKLKIKF